MNDYPTTRWFKCDEPKCEHLQLRLVDDETQRPKCAFCFCTTTRVPDITKEVTPTPEPQVQDD